MSEELKPCPLCESRAVTDFSPGSYWELPKKRGFIHCMTCGCSAPEKAWNTLSNEALRAENARLREALEKARDTFQRYGDLHNAKNTPDGHQKAAVNYALALEMDEALGEQP